MNLLFPALFLLGFLLGALLIWLVLRGNAAALNAQLTAERQAAGEKVKLVEDAGGRLREAFAAASQDALRQNSEQFLGLAESRFKALQEAAQVDLEGRQKSIDALVKPVNDGLEKLDTRLQAFDKERATSHAALTEQLQQMAMVQKDLSGETQALVKALRLPQVRGQWGEMQLRRAVELAGMLEHCDFVEQESVQTEGGRLRPDMIVRLPGQKAIIVDSKAPLAAYLDAMETQDPDQQAAHLLNHARQVRTHVSSLADKDYSKQFSESPDFVILFLPGEAFFSAACAKDPGLVDFAISRRVIPASPTTLITLLKAVSYGWRQERIAENAEEIRGLGQELHERVGVMARHMVGMRDALEKTVETWNSTVGSLESRVLATTRKFSKLGAGSEKEVPLIEALDVQPRRAVAGELAARSDGVAEGAGELGER